MKPAPLTADERRRLDRLETQVEAGVNGVMVMIEAGRALAEIRDAQLFRTTATTWEAYVDQRFRITKRRCDQMIAFAGIVDAVSSIVGTTVPDLTERAVRPLVGLDAEQLTDVVTEAAEDPAGITPATLRKAAAKRKAKKAKVARPVRFRVPGWIIVATPNKKATGTVAEALAAAIVQAEDDGQSEAA